jgi:hypothetical protein
MEKNFTQISNEILDNKELSLEQKGLLAIMYRNSDDWKNYQSELITRSSCGRDKHSRILKELSLLGYVKKVFDGDLRDKSNGKFCKGETYWKLIKTTVDWNPVTGNQQLETSNGLTASNNTKVNKTNQIKQIKESVSVEKYTSSSENFSSDEVETDSDSYFDFISNDEWVIFDNGFESSKVETETDSDSKIEKKISISHSNEKNIHTSKKEYLKVEPSTEKKKFFFRVNEKPDYHRLEEYFHSKGYSSAQALEMHKRLLSTNFKSASGEQIKFLDSYINRELQNIKPDLSNEDINSLVNSLSGHINSNLKNKDKDEYFLRNHTNKLDSKEWIQEKISKMGLEKVSALVLYVIENDKTSTNIYQMRNSLNARKKNLIATSKRV